MVRFLDPDIVEKVDKSFIHILETCVNNNSSSGTFLPHIKVSTFRFAGNSTKPSTICQNSSAIILAVLALCIEHVLVLAGCEVVRGPGATRLVFFRVIFWVIWIFITGLWHFILSLPARFPIYETILHKFEQFYFHYSNKCFTIIQDKILSRFLGRSYFAVIMYMEGSSRPDAGCNTLVDPIFVRTVSIPNLSLLPRLEVAWIFFCETN